MKHPLVGIDKAIYSFWAVFENLRPLSAIARVNPHDSRTKPHRANRNDDATALKMLFHGGEMNTGLGY